MYNQNQAEYYMCPRCGKTKLFKKSKNTVVIDAEFKCKHCGTVTVNYIPESQSQSQSQRARARAD